MEQLKYQIEIAASPKKVWQAMLQKNTYEQWVAKSWPDSSYEGEWKQGTKINFIGPDGSGTQAELVEVKPYEKVLARHIAILTPGQVADTTSEMAKNWIGMTEEYQLREQVGKTHLTVNIQTYPEWRHMFEEGWPTALEELKGITERQLTEA